MKSYIGIYDDALSEDDCSKLISYFCSNPTTVGRVWSNGQVVVLPNHKKSTELDRCFYDKHPIINEICYSALKKYTSQYVDEYNVLGSYNVWGVDNSFTFKKFDGEDEGYKAWHTEHQPGAPSSRILVYNFYINDAQSGTEFKYYPTVEAKRGRLVIWPSSWTHYHRSEPNRGLKYIISGWYSFKT